MKHFILFTFIGVICLRSSNAQTIKAGPENWIAQNSKVDFKDDAIYLTKASQKSALLWAKDLDFKSGIIDFDVKGKDIRGESFLGIAFHGLDSIHYDAIYFRPFNFRDPEKKARSVQYISMPGSDWDVLREKFPGKYEAAMNPVPDPNEWFHVRIVIHSPMINVYVNNAKEPSLTVEQIGKTMGTKLGLWIDGPDGWFRNIVINSGVRK